MKKKLKCAKCGMKEKQGTYSYCSDCLFFINKCSLLKRKTYGKIIAILIGDIYRYNFLKNSNAHIKIKCPECQKKIGPKAFLRKENICKKCKKEKEIKICDKIKIKKAWDNMQDENDFYIFSQKREEIIRVFEEEEQNKKNIIIKGGYNLIDVEDFFINRGFCEKKIKKILYEKKINL